MRYLADVDLCPGHSFEIQLGRVASEFETRQGTVYFNLTRARSVTKTVIHFCPAGST